jgi:hypothetical protein
MTNQLMAHIRNVDNIIIIILKAEEIHLIVGNTIMNNVKRTKIYLVNSQ